MSSAPIQQHPASVDAYIRQGWSLVPIPPGTKGPRSSGWNHKEMALKSHAELPPGYGIGLAHAYSGTMALDIDNWTAAAALLAPQGVDIQALYAAPDAVTINSGKPGHGKLLYSMPFGVALPSKKILHSGVTAYELRCATANGLTVQDVMPPSIHPETLQPYQWAGLGHWTALPTIPRALLDVWEGILTQDRQRTISVGGAIDASWEELRQAIAVVPPDCSRDEWINVGMALHWAGTQTGQLPQALHLWNDWSGQSATKYPGERGILQQWESFREDKASSVKLGTLFHIAKQHGWQRPQPDIKSLFQAINSTNGVKTPADISASLRPPAPDMDMSLWPAILATRAQEVSDSVGCDPLVPLFAGLAAVCGVVDARIRLELMPGFKVPPVLWLMTIGDPADKKSPGSRPMLSAIKNIEADDRPRYQKELLTWEGKEAAYASAKKAFLEFSASPEALLDGQAPNVPDMPPQPVALKITVSDITSQKLVRHAAERPRGLLCYLDEMNSWVKKMVDRTSSEDRSSWVVSYESERYEMDRVGTGSTHCDNLAVSIYGNIQPRIFKENIAALSADGLLQRFIPGVLRGSKTRLGNPVPEYMTSTDAWENLLRTVYALPEQDYRLSPSAYDAFREFQRAYELAKQDERLLMSNDTYMTAFGKLEGTAGRLILLFHLIEKPFDVLIGAPVVHRVVQMIQTYLIPAYRYALGDIGGVDMFDQWVSDYVIHYADTGTLTLSEVRRSARRQIGEKNQWDQDKMVLNSMHVLEHAGWVVRLDDGSREHQHMASWAINPALHERFAAHRKAVIAAKQRVQSHIYRLNPNPRPPVYGFEPDDNVD